MAYAAKVVDRVWYYIKYMSELTGKSLSTFYVLKHRDNRMDRTDRFKIIDGKIYVHIDYKNMGREEIDLARDLYYQALEVAGTQCELSKLIEKFTGFPHNRVNIYLNDFRFAVEDLRKIYIEAFKKIVNSNDHGRNAS